MSHSSGITVGGIIKVLLLAMLKLLGIVCLFVFKILALLFEKLSEVLEKAIGHGKGH